MIKAESYWISIAEMEAFSTDAEKVFNASEMDALIQCLSINPFYGEAIADTDGVRLVRWPAVSQGKGGHVRVLYYFRDLNTPVYLLSLLERGERLSLSSPNKQLIRMLVGEIVASLGARRDHLVRFPSGAA